MARFSSYKGRPLKTMETHLKALRASVNWPKKRFAEYASADHEPHCGLPSKQLHRVHPCLENLDINRFFWKIAQGNYAQPWLHSIIKQIELLRKVGTIASRQRPENRWRKRSSWLDRLATNERRLWTWMWSAFEWTVSHRHRIEVHRYLWLAEPCEEWWIRQSERMPFEYYPIRPIR